MHDVVLPRHCDPRGRHRLGGHGRRVARLVALHRGECGSDSAIIALTLAAAYARGAAEGHGSGDRRGDAA
jgi:hypothetical protein